MDLQPEKQVPSRQQALKYIYCNLEKKLLFILFDKNIFLFIF